MEKCGCRRMIGYSARGSFRSTDVNLTIPVRVICLRVGHLLGELHSASFILCRSGLLNQVSPSHRHSWYEGGHLLS
jgi:hypothetical protein